MLKSSISKLMCFDHHHLLPLRVNQMMSGNPNWWSSSTDMRCSQAQKPCPSLFPQYAAAGSSNSLPFNSLANTQDFQPSWSQLLMGGLASDEEDKFGILSHFQESKKLENWDDQILNNPSFRVPVADVKQEGAQSCQLYGHGSDDDYEFQTCRPSWSQVMPPAVSSHSVSSTLSCSGNILDFSNSLEDGRNQHPDHKSECNSTLTGGVAKKARVQSSSTQPPLKVRKEKLGDRITALHQLVSPFGKTDTASVLLEAIGSIRFLQGQIQALTSPYLGNPSAHFRHQQPVQVDQRSCAFPVDSGQLLNDNCLRRRGAPKQGNQDGSKDLRSRGLCLVPLSCTHHVGRSDQNGGAADYWAPSLGGRF